MTEKPTWIRDFDRPPGTEIKHISGHWYLYERLSVYNRTIKKKQKKSGRILGSITENGLVPSKRNSPLPKTPMAGLENREYGATALLLSLSESMRFRLEKLFPDCWKELFTLAVMKCKEQAPFKRMDFCYQTSYLEQILGPLSLSTGRISELLKAIGTNREAIRSYMKEDLPESGIIMFDGHRIISASKTMDNAQIGYDSRCRFLPQVNLVYMFSVQGDRKLPIFYKQFSGAVPDVSAFADMVQDAGLKHKDVLVIADKGFESDLNEEMLREASLDYVLAVRRGCAEVVDIPDRPEHYKFAFNFRGRAIYCNEYPGEKENTFLYYDLSLANDEAADFIMRREKTNTILQVKIDKEDKRRRNRKGRLSPEEYAKLKPVNVAEALQDHKATGTFILKSSRKDLNCVQAYHTYKTRQDIEQAFKCYDDTLDCTASYMRDGDAFEAWLFINHLALQMLYGVIQVIADRDLSAKYSFDDAIAFLKHVHVNLIDGKWLLTKVTKHTAKMCKEIGIEMGDTEVLKVTLK